MHEDSKCPLFGMTATKFNYLMACIAGTLFSVGWWLAIDAHAQPGSILQSFKVYHLPGVFGTFLLICVNSIPTELLHNSYSYSDRRCCSPFVARITLFLFFKASFCCLIAAFYILINDFILDESKDQWPGYAVCLQNVFILGSSLLLKFGKRNEDW